MIEFVIGEEEKPKKKRGRPTLKEQKKRINAQLKKSRDLKARGGLPSMCTGPYDTWDTRALDIISKRNIVYLIASLGGSQADCARYAKISQPAVTKNYSEEYYTGKADLKMRIRLAQLGRALEGETTLLKHLGMVHCEEQKDVGTTSLEKDELRGIIEMYAGQGITSMPAPKEEAEEE